MNNNSIRVLVLSLATVFIFGCASAAKAENMVIAPSPEIAVKFDPALKNTIDIQNVEGGQKTNPMWTSEIGNDEFKSALSQSLKNLQLLGADNAKYQLQAKLISVEQPLFGLSFRVTTKVEYSLVEKLTGQEVLKKVIQAQYEAGMGDSVVAVKRLRLANEGSAKNNISEFIKSLSEFKIGTDKVSVVQ